MFENKIQDRPMVIHMLATPGESIYPQAFKLDRALRYRDRTVPGIVFIYSGQNERFVNGAIQTPRVQKVINRACTHSLLLSTLWYYGEKKLILPHVRTLGTYEFYLRQAIETSLKNGLTPVLSTVVSNIADIEPGLLQTGRWSKPQAIEAIQKGEALEDAGQDRKAIDYYESLARENSSVSAYMKFRIGKCYEHLKDYPRASRYYWEATDTNWSDNFGRAVDLQNDLIRRLSREYRIPLVDAVDLFEAHAPHGLLGKELFMDGQHPNLDGYLLLAYGFAKALSNVSGEPIRTYLTKADVLRLFAYSKDRQVHPFLAGGKWLLIMSMRHAYPRWRLQLAADCYQQALALKPSLFSAWLLWGVVDAARRTRMLLDEQDLQWLNQNGFFDYNKFNYVLTPQQFQGILVRLREAGVPSFIRDGMERSYKESSARA
jgi:tetratricopeptide (TPR) repeat protein